MGWHGWAGASTSAARVVLAAPLAALAVAPWADRAPDGSLRATGVHLALAVLDPQALEAARESLAVAAGVAGSALVLGLGLARAVRRSGLGPRATAFLIGWPLAVPPAFAALGLMGGMRAAGLGPESAGGWAGRLAWAWAELAWAVPLVTLAALRPLRGIEPAREEAARQLGGARSAWRTLLRPIARPPAASAAATAFGLALLEPGAPWVLGLRRSLAVQVLESALRPESLPRAAALALVASALAWALGRVLAPRPLEIASAPTAPAAPSTPRGRRLLGLAALAAWTVPAALPWAGLLASAVRGEAGPSRGAGVADAVAASAALGASAATLALLAGWSMGGRPRRAGGRADGRVAALPPLATAVGVVALGRLLEPAPAVAATTATPAGPDPSAFAFGMLVAAVACVHLPSLAATARRVRSRVAAGQVESARTLGAGRWRAFRTVVAPQVVPPLLAAWLRVAVASGLSVAAALALSPTSDVRPIGPAVLDLVGGPDGPAVAARLALAATLAALASAALAAFAGEDRPEALPPP